ncbi:hypothetical protein PFNF135_01700, partial [Plasmodium falciparum NF135/5.C10]
LNEKFSLLHTDIQSDDIPTCICEKSLADKTEKFCLNCGVQLGGGVLQASGLLGGIGQLGLDAWKAAALVTAKKLAAEAGAAAGLKAGDALGMKIVIKGLKALKVDTLKSGIYKTFVTTKRYSEVTGLVDIIDTEMNKVCSVTYVGDQSICAVRNALGVIPKPGGTMVNQKDAITNVVTDFVDKAKLSADTEAANVIKATSSKIIAKQTTAINSTYASYEITIIASIIAILIIVLIMKKEIEEKTPIYKIIRRIDMITLSYS